MQTKDSKEHLLYLDGWRGLAIASVLIGHFIPIPGINMGRVGVELFFVLSGRLMAEILFIKQVPLILFFKRRISRVWPALFLFVIIMGMIFNHFTGRLHVSFFSVMTSLTFIANYVSVFGDRTPILDHIWSLCVEEHTYIFLAMIAFTFRKNITRQPEYACLLFAILCFTNGFYQTVFLNKDYYSVYWRTDTRMASILLAGGLYLYIYKNNRSLIVKDISILFFLIGMVLNLKIMPDYIKYTFGTIFFALSLCFLDNISQKYKKILESRNLVLLGLWSFSLYLWQQPFCKLIVELGYLYMPILLLTTFAIAYLSYNYIENPTRIFLNKHWAK